jgi:ABC-type multidrug transport system ATPase subunit
MKLLAGSLRPGAGEIEFKEDTSRKALFSRVGWMPQTIRPIKGLTCKEQLVFAGWVAGLGRDVAESRADSWLERVDLAEHSRRRSDQLSGGQVRRLGLAQAMMRDSHVLLLDEPTAGLDPAQAQHFREILRSLDLPGGVLISTHHASEIVNEVDGVVVLARGTVKFTGPVETFLQQAEQGKTSVDEIFSRMVDGGLH